MTEDKGSRRKELTDLLRGLSTQELKAITKDLGITGRQIPKPTTHRFKAKRYVNLTKITTCKHCGSKNIKDIKLKRPTRNGEVDELVFVDELGNTIIQEYTTTDEGMVVDTWVNSCDKCRGFIEHLPRHQLENMYMQLLRTGARSTARLPSRLLDLPFQEEFCKCENYGTVEGTQSSTTTQGEETT